MRSGLLFSVCALLGFVTVSSFAETAPTGIRFGVQGGVDITSQSENRPYLSVNNPIAGFFGGGFLDVPLSHEVSIVPELDFAMKGAQYTGPGAFFTDRLYYLEIPVSLKYKWDFQSFNLFVLGGPQLGILMTSSSTNNYTGFSQNPVGLYNTIDFGLLGGLGAGIPVGNFDLLLAGRFAYGLNDITAFGYGVHNVEFQLTAGIEF